MVSVLVSDITNPPPVPCSVFLDPSVKQQMPWVLAELSVFLYSSVSEAVG